MNLFIYLFSFLLRVQRRKTIFSCFEGDGFCIMGRANKNLGLKLWTADPLIWVFKRPDLFLSGSIGLIMQFLSSNGKDFREKFATRVLTVSQFNFQV